jgi:hypothetical protein
MWSVVIRVHLQRHGQYWGTLIAPVLRVGFEFEFEERIGDLGPTLAAKNVHLLSRHGHGEVATSRGTLPLLHHLDPTSTVPLEMT